jgi:hypothetical protein
MIDISTLPKATNPVRVTIAVGTEQSTATLNILPLPVRRPPTFTEWMKVRQRLGQIVQLNPGWNGGRGVPPDLQTVVFAGEELASFERLGLPAPAIHPSPDGAVYAEWHSKGLDIEIAFEAPYMVIVLAQDARGEMQPIEAESSDATIALDALKALASR